MTDEIWYYADRQRQNRGPLTAVAIAALFRKGELDAQTLVWRETMAEWEPLSQHASEFGLAANEMDPGFTMPLNPLPTATPLVFARDRSAEVVYAGFWRRFAALVIDRLLIMLVLTIIGVAVVLVVMSVSPAKAQSSSSGGDAAAGVVQILVWLGYLLIAPIYFAVQESSAHQATLGKRAMGIKVTTLDGKRLSFGHALGRWAAAAISYMTFYIGFIMAGFTERKQALHDLVAGTLVVDRWAFTDSPGKQQQGTSGCLLAVIIGAFAFIPVVAILAAIAISQYQDYVGRSQVYEGVAISDGLKTQVAEAYAQQGKCPTNGDEGFQSPEAYAGKYVASATLGELGNGNCAIEIRFGGTLANRQIAGKTLVFEAARNGQSLEWSCRSEELKDKFLPTVCRSGNGSP